jgi:hypothetical protein
LSDRFKMLMSIKHSDSENIAELSWAIYESE